MSTNTRHPKKKEKQVNSDEPVAKKIGGSKEEKNGIQERKYTGKSKTEKKKSKRQIKSKQEKIRRRVEEERDMIGCRPGSISSCLMGFLSV